MDPAAVQLAPLLDQLVNYERSRPNQALWDLAAMQRLLARPGAAAPPRPAVQIGGSKGKGTAAAMLAMLAGRAGLRAGVYTSPHVDTLLERLRIGSDTITVARLAPILRDLLATAADRAPTFFEALTAAAVQWFAEERVDLAIYEVGLGGRLDATTAVPVDASLLTTIELEHTDVLGDTIAAIATEKAAIVRPGGLGFTTATGEALAVVQDHARRVDARLLVHGVDFEARLQRDRGDALLGDIRLPTGGMLPFALRDGALYELPALAMAAACLSTLSPSLVLELRDLPRPQQSCRFELIADDDGATWILDGAHTERSIAAVAAELERRWPGQRPQVLFASASGKRWRESLSSMLPVADRFLVTEVTGTSSEDAAVIVAHLCGLGVMAQRVDDVEHGLAALRAHDGLRLVIGSFYLVGAVRRLLARTKNAR